MGSYRFLSRLGLIYLPIAAAAVGVILSTNADPRVQLVVIYSVFSLSLPLFITPASRWLTKLTFRYMRYVNRRFVDRYNAEEQAVASGAADPDRFLEQLKKQNMAVALVRVACLWGVVIVFYSTISPLAFFLQEQVLYLEGAFDLSLLLWTLVRFVVAFVICGAISGVHVLIVVRLFNYLTRDQINDYVEIQVRANTAVAAIYAALLVGTFFFAGDVARRIADLWIYG